VKLLTRVVGGFRGIGTERSCQLLPGTRSLEITIRPPPSVDTLLAVSLPGCPAPNDAAIAAWLAHTYGERAVRVLPPSSFRPLVLGDFLDAVNAEQHIAAATREFGVDAVAAFARVQGGELLAEIRGELEGGVRPDPARLAWLVVRIRRFAKIITGDTAIAVLAELAALHDVEHLLGLEHAVGQWIAAAASPRGVTLGALARMLPNDSTSAGVSHAWFWWWWKLAYTCTRVDLMTIVDRTVDIVDDHCTQGRREPVADHARAEARRMAEQMRDAPRAEMWRGAPAPELRPEEIDPGDAYYAAFMAVSHAAHALAYALRGQMPAPAANRVAMQMLAELAVRFLIDDQGEPR
jgi:hypothetical protein